MLYTYGVHDTLGLPYHACVPLSLELNQTSTMRYQQVWPTTLRDSGSYTGWCSARLCHHTPPGTHRTPQSQRTPKKLKDQKACESSAGQSATYHCSIIGFVFGAVAAPGAFGFQRPRRPNWGSNQAGRNHRQKPMKSI